MNRPAMRHLRHSVIMLAMATAIPAQDFTGRKDDTIPAQAEMI